MTERRRASSFPESTPKEDGWMILGGWQLPPLPDASMTMTPQQETVEGLPHVLEESLGHHQPQTTPEVAEAHIPKINQRRQGRNRHEENHIHAAIEAAATKSPTGHQHGKKGLTPCLWATTTSRQQVHHNSNQV
mmetsp:Transcript_3526/g.7870  ORF Transcript_3526/g.7870 Transcript_3526/m.7870 type:complete len:134 (+) Transcript_3526:531-932(+)